MANEKGTRWLILYFILAFFISWALWIPSVLNSNGTPMPGFLLLISNFALLGPGIAAIIVLAFSKGRSGIKALFKNAWNWKFNKLWLIAVICIPLAVIGISYVIKQLAESQAFALGDVGMPIPLFVIFMLFAGGPLEEFGWRGFALPALLKKMPLVAASLVLGVLHGLWHLPLHFMEGTVQANIPIWEFIAVTAVGAIIYSWLFVKTNGSLIAMIIHHWSANLFSALLVYWDTSLGRWVFFGAQLITAVVIVLIYNKSNDKSKLPDILKKIA
jgi:uncharacterized protein